MILIAAWVRDHRGLVEILVVLLVLALMVWAAVEHERNVGATACVQKNTDEHVAELVRDARQETRDAAAINQEAANYAAAITPGSYVLSAPISVCRVVATLHQAGAAELVSNGPTGVPGGDRGRAPEGYEVGKPLENVGRRADAQVAELQAYVRDVCLGGAQ